MELPPFLPKRDSQGELLFARIKNLLVPYVARPEDGFNVLLSALAQLLPKPLDMNIHGARPDAFVVAPNCSQQVAAREANTGIVFQHFEQTAFFSG